MARKSLDDILDGNEPEVQEAEAVEPAPEPEQPEPQPRDEQGKFAEKGDKPEPETQEPEAEPPSAGNDADTGLLAAKQAEKAKRQAAEKERDDFAAQLKALRDELHASKQQEPKEPPKPAPDIWEDTQGWQNHFGGQVVDAATQQAAYQNKLSTSEFYARKNIEGFDNEWENLNQWLTENPAIAQQAAADYDPWGFAWRQYDNQRQLKELGATDVASLEQKLREKILAELQEQTPAEPQKVPPTLSTKRSVGSRSGPAWTGPTPLGDLIGN